MHEIEKIKQHLRLSFVYSALFVHFTLFVLNDTKLFLLKVLSPAQDILAINICMIMAAQVNITFCRDIP